MAMTVHCDIVSAGSEIFSGLVEMVVASGHDGELGIIYHHAPLLTSLIPGYVRVIKQGGTEEVFYVSGGYLEVQPTHVSILADEAERAGDIDEASAEKARQDALNAIAGSSGECDYEHVTMQLAEAEARLRAIKQLKQR